MPASYPQSSFRTSRPALPDVIKIDEQTFFVGRERPCSRCFEQGFRAVPTRDGAPPAARNPCAENDIGTGAFAPYNFRRGFCLPITSTAPGSVM
jgi:hypothetical protein